jgi:hypothetical protein
MKLIAPLLALFLFFTLTFFSPFNLLASYDWNDHFFDQSEPDSEKFKYICDYEPFPEMLISIPHKNFMFHFTEERISKLDGHWVNPGCYKESLTIRDLNKDGKIVYQRKTEDFYYVDATETEFIELGGIDYAFISRYTRGAKSYYGYSFIPLNTFEVKFSFVQTKRSPLILFRKLNTVIECESDPYWESNEYLYFFTPEGIERSKLNKKEFIQVLKNNYKIKDDFTFCLKDVNWRLGNQGINDFDEYNLKDR